MDSTHEINNRYNGFRFADGKFAGKAHVLEFSQTNFHFINGRLKTKIQVSDDLKKTTISVTHKG